MLQVVVMGKSLGGAVSLHLAADNPTLFKAIVVENTFLSIEDVAPKVRCSAILCPLQIGRNATTSQQRARLCHPLCADAPIPGTCAGQRQVGKLSDSQQVEELRSHTEDRGDTHPHVVCWAGKITPLKCCCIYFRPNIVAQC